MRQRQHHWKTCCGRRFQSTTSSLRFPTIPPETSKVDIIIQNMSDCCWNVVKVIYLEKSISSAAALSMCSGKPFVPVFRNGPHAVKKAVQWALARVRRHHVHWHKLDDKSQDTLHRSSSNLWSPENDELAEGIRYINTFAPDCDALNQQTYWILTNIKPDSGTPWQVGQKSKSGACAKISLVVFPGPFP